jgi:hypothetical protein
VCFARLVVHPSGLIVDPIRPSIDRANLAGPRAVGNDLIGYVLPQYLSITQTLARYGHIPWWDTRGFAGRPLCGNPQSGLFYPPVWAAWWLKSPAALGWLTVAHLVWGGLGVYRLSRSLGLRRWAATVAGGIYQASPLLLAHTFEGHYPHVWSACWYPWAFWCFARWRGGSIDGAIFLPVVLALTYLTGHPQEWLLLVLALVAWLIVDILNILRDRGAVRAGFVALHGAGLLALSLGLVAVEIAPELAVRPWLLHNRIPTSGPAMPRRYDLGALNAFQLLSPGALGGPADYFGDDNYWETVFSFGLVSLTLAVIAAMCRTNRKLLRGWLLLFGLSVWFACGRNLGLYALLYSIVPGMSWFRVPARSLFLATLGAAVMAGVGIDTLHREFVERRAWRALARRLGVGLLAACVALVIFRYRGGTVSPQRSAMAAERVLDGPGFWLALGGLMILLGMGCVYQRDRWRRTAGALLGLVAVLELGWAGYSLIEVAPAQKFLGHDPIGSAINRLAQADRDNGPVRIKARDTFYGDLPAVSSGLEKTNINDVCQLDQPARMYEVLYRSTGRPRPHEANLCMKEPVADFERKVRQAVFDRMGVSYLVSDRYEPDPGWLSVATGQTGGSPYVVALNPTALSRAYVVPRATVVAEPPPYILSLFRELDPHESVIMDHDPLAAVERGPRQSFTAARWASRDPDHPVMQVRTRAPGLLVVADTWMPGWTARVDDEIVPVLRGNMAQRVIPILHSGNHTVTMSYQPPGLVLGGMVTSVSIVAWVACAGLVAIRRRNEVAMRRQREGATR